MYESLIANVNATFSDVFLIKSNFIYKKKKEEEIENQFLGSTYRRKEGS